MHLFFAHNGARADRYIGCETGDSADRWLIWRSCRMTFQFLPKHFTQSDYVYFYCPLIIRIDFCVTFTAIFHRHNTCKYKCNSIKLSLYQFGKNEIDWPIYSLKKAIFFQIAERKLKLFSFQKEANMDLMNTHKFFQWIFLSLGKKSRKLENNGKLKKKRFSSEILKLYLFLFLFQISN